MTDRLEGAPVAERLYAEAQSILRGFPDRPPALVSVHLGRPTPFSFYLRQQAKAAARAGIHFRSEALPEGTGAPQLREHLRRLDENPEVDAVLLEHPLPAELDFLGAVGRLRPEKDVDGVGAVSLGLLVARHPVHVPAVARAALEIARHYGVPVEGRSVAVVGRSETVGVPLALMLLARGSGADATVTVAHTKTKDLARALANAEVIFSCAGKAGLLNRSVVREGVRIIDVGVSSVPDPAKPGGFRAAGDADAASLDGWAAALTPVPGGVGPVTNAALMLGVAEARAALERRAKEP
ncbi:MAG TPA: bifunctional 5,10-methylenetetrahydrofolate dehydrogenase/5,10-methenyltetrahydrofolate cyclohydrolase [Thermoplasmata archaeon]|nr:bifunctional 5,10-methylenetetrahydrofolate dehydrogenase/5,10-methenyltetrahydrofolate cyclohydrolase [Thermoplasmata archaeon]